jgi:hypothetical protein
LSILAFDPDQILKRFWLRIDEELKKHPDRISEVNSAPILIKFLLRRRNSICFFYS